MRDYVIQATGFKSPAEMYAEKGVEWEQLLFPKPHAMYPMRVRGNTPFEYGIFGNDILIIDCTQNPGQGRLIVAALDGQFLLGTIEKEAGQQIFRTGDETIQIHRDTDFRVVGTVSRLVRFYNGAD